jgi:cytochrome c oxidase assembly protein subunit 16
MGGPFQSKSFRATIPSSIASRYRKALTKHPFLLFGLPFLTTIVAGSFMLTPATALRYERFDRKNQRITQEEKMGLGQNRRKVNMKDEYYVSFTLIGKIGGWEFGTVLILLQRLQAKDLENWEQRRVKRLPGEVDGVMEWETDAMESGERIGIRHGASHIKPWYLCVEVPDTNPSTVCVFDAELLPMFITKKWTSARNLRLANLNASQNI